MIVDFGIEKVRDKRFGMPKFAEYVAEECKKHTSMSPSNLYGYYNKRLEDEL